MRETEIKVDTKDVIVGMYITRIDRPWLESPFLLQGFMINDDDDKKLLVKHCTYCYIDISRSKKMIQKKDYGSQYQTPDDYKKDVFPR